jgi:uncharacterized protein Yka (UPF0111/DUF47 family)
MSTHIEANEASVLLKSLVALEAELMEADECVESAKAEVERIERRCDKLRRRIPPNYE